MTERFVIAAACLGVGVFLACILILAWATAEDFPPPPVRLEDKSTWRRPRVLAAYASHLAGFLLFAALVIGAISFP
jgi:hypothetical protein